MAISKGNLWGIGLMLIGVALAIFVGKTLGALCGLVGIAIISWAQFHEAKSLTQSEGERHYPSTFVLEVAGTQPLSSESSDWKFLVTNCGERPVRYVRLGAIRSELELMRLFSMKS